MATRAQIIEQVRRRLAGGDPSWDFKIDQREIALAADEIRDNLVTIKLYQSLQGEDREVDGSYLVTYDDVPVLFDQHSKQYYSELPAKLLSLPRDRGIEQVMLKQDLRNTFIPIKLTEIPLFSTVGSVLDGNYAYYRSGEKLFYYNVPISGFPCGLTMVLIPQGKYVPDDQNYCDPDLQDTIVTETFKRFVPMSAKPEDKNNNGVSN